MNNTPGNIEDLLTSIFDILEFSSEQREQGFKDFGGLVKVKFTQELLEGLSDSEKSQLSEQVKGGDDGEIQEQIAAIIKEHYSEADLANQNRSSAEYALDEYLRLILKQANTEQQVAVRNLVQQLK
jgi:hypothetical protein